MTLPAPLDGIARLSAMLQADDAALPEIWKAFESELKAAFGHKLFTILSYDPERQLMVRVHSNQLEFNPIGGAKRVTESPWSRQVLKESRMLVGSNREDIKAVFSEYEKLWGIGCESVLNIPVRVGGVTIGTLNLLDGAGHYDLADLDLALVYAQLASDPLAKYLANAKTGDYDEASLEHV
jgi:transcriptional regulator with GAF, ATPase, and Fis domain